MKYNEQQMAIINSPYAKGMRKVVEAYSGCGKSTTLIGLANKRLDMKVLYLSFNASVAKEAKRKFPKHVDCMTMHSLAYRNCGERFKEHLGNPDNQQVMSLLKRKVNSNFKLMLLAHHAIATFENWCASDRSQPSWDDFSKETSLAVKHGDLSHELVLDSALSILEAMCACEMTVSHSLYLKLYQLSSPILPYHVIMVDEAQDLNPAVMHIIHSQRHAEVIKVGDSHQSIYEFRGAVDALKDDEAQRFYLTETYRFGQNLADLASSILINHKSAKLPLIGKGQHIELNSSTDEHGSPLTICRTTAGVMECLINLCLGDGSQNNKIYMPSGSKNYKLRQMCDAYKLMKKQEGVGAYAQYKSWEQYEDYAEASGDTGAQNTVRIVSRYKGGIPATVAELTSKEVTSAKNATHCITTAHKSKGLEHPMILIAQDFPQMMKADRPPVSRQEINLMYVAITRAQRCIFISPEIRYVINSKILSRKLTDEIATDD